MGISAKMISIAAILSTCLVLSGAVAPLTPEELQHIRDFTAKAHMKRVQSFPDQIMTASNTETHYVGRRIPAVEKPPPTFFMQAPSNINQVVKPTQFALASQPTPAVQNYLINYPIGPSNPPRQIFQQRPQPQLQFIQVQNAPQGGPNGPGQLRGPQPQQSQHPQHGQQHPQHPHHPQNGPQQQFNKRPSFFSFGGPESSPHQSIFSFFFPRRPARRPNFRTPLRFEFAAAPQNPLQQHNQNLHNVMAQQHLITVQQQAQGQQSVVQPSIAPNSPQSTTIKTALGVQTVPTAGPSPGAPILQTATLVPLQGRFVPVNQQLVHGNAPPLQNQFHRETSFFGKHFGKPRPLQKLPPGAFIPQNRPGDGNQYVQKYAGPQDFSFFPFRPPPVIAGPTSTRFGNAPPVSFSHIEQLPFTLQRPQALPMPMIVQSQEFPNYHFSTTFATGGQNQVGKAVAQPGPINTPAASQSSSTTKSQDGQNVPSQTGTLRAQRVRKVKARITTPVTTTLPPPPSSTLQSLGDIIFESSKETREFHDSARLVASPSVTFNSNDVKARKPKQQSPDNGSLQKASGVESSVVLAPLVFAKESSEPATSTTSPRPPSSSTSVSVSTVSTTTEEPYKSKIIKSKGVEFHKSKNVHHNHNHNHHNHHNHHHHHHTEKKVTASGAGLMVTAEPLRLTSTGSTSTSSRITASPGRVVTTSITSCVVSTGGPPNTQKRYRLRKVKVPNPDAKSNKQTTSPIPPSSSGSSSTTIVPSTTTSVSSSSSRPPRSTSTLSSSTTTSTTTEGSTTTTN